MGNPFDTEESLSDALELLLSFETPIRLNTYKMQYFPHYPFTNMALEAGHISAEDVSDEGVERATMYEFAYRPKFPALNRRDYMENCIYLIPWTSKPIRRLLRRIQKRHNPILGLLASVLANLRYWQAFKGVAALVWARRLYVALKLIASGDIKTLLSKFRQISSNANFDKMKTGRLSSR